MIPLAYMQLRMAGFDEAKFKDEVLRSTLIELGVEPSHPNYQFDSMLGSCDIAVMQDEDPDEYPAMLVRLRRAKNPYGIKTLVFYLDEDEQDWVLCPAYAALIKPKLENVK